MQMGQGYLLIGGGILLQDKSATLPKSLIPAERTGPQVIQVPIQGNITARHARILRVAYHPRPSPPVKAPIVGLASRPYHVSRCCVATVNAAKQPKRNWARMTSGVFDSLP